MTLFVYFALGVAFMMAYATAKVIDLSHKHGPNTLMSIHGAPPYNLTNLYRGDSMLSVFVELNYYGSSEHGGTHMDAPSHFTKGGMTLDDIPLEHTIVEGVMIDCSKEAAANSSHVVQVSKLEEWERTYGEIPSEAAVLFYFAWYQKFDNEALYRGTTDVGNSHVYVYPSVSETAARWLLDNRSVRILGSDTITVDRFPSNMTKEGFPIHRMILPLNRFIIENLRDLDKLPPRNFRFHASPVKYVGASGAQVRAYAMTYDENCDNGVGSVRVSALISLCLALLALIVMQ